MILYISVGVLSFVFGWWLGRKIKKLECEIWRESGKLEAEAEMLAKRDMCIDWSSDVKNGGGIKL